MTSSLSASSIPSRNYRIRLFSNFDTPEKVKKSLEHTFCANNNPYYGDDGDDGDEKDKKVYFTTDDDYTHAIIFNTEMPRLRNDIPKSRVVGLAYEPNYPAPFLNVSSTFVEYAKRFIGKYYIGDTRGLPEPFVDGYAYITYSRPKWNCTDAPIPRPITETNTKLISIMISQKMFAPGHVYRHRLVREILRLNLPVDIYGRGCVLYKNTEYANDPRFKGSFQEYEPYESYKFHIAIENIESNYYFSEKIINPLLAGAIPVYLGCRNIREFFGDSVILMENNMEKDIQLITDIVRHPEKYMQSRTIDVVAVEERVNLIKNVDRIFKLD